MLITRENLADVLRNLQQCNVLAVDTETTGLSPQADTIFAIAFCDGVTSWWADFRQGEIRLEDFRELFAQERTWVGHNVKYDVMMIESGGVPVQGTLYCTHVGARLERNDHMKYGLDACAERAGLGAKEDLKAYMDKYELFERVKFEGKKKIEKRYFFHRVPHEIIGSYILQDVLLAWQLRSLQLISFQKWEREGIKSVLPLVKLEGQITRVVADMELTGVKVDREYCKHAYTGEVLAQQRAMDDFTKLTGEPYVDSEKTFVPIFERFGLPIGRTEKGNPSFTDDVLAPITHPIAQSIRAYRNAAKRGGTYFASFLTYSEHDGRLHASFNQGGTGTGRFSSSNPNLQNLTSDTEESDYPIRRCFIPDHEYVFVSCDYSQMEYRLMLDYAGEMEVIRQVLSGVDLHQACANLMGVDRRSAKTINFALLYGAGNEKLADQLGVSSDRAKELRELYFKSLPEVRSLVRAISDKAKYQGIIFNWMGRRYHFPDRNYAYKAPNYLIQGGSADIVRVAMLGVWQDFQGTKSKLVMQIHDELVALIHRSELHLVEGIKRRMVEAYKPRYLPMDVNIYWSDKSLYDLEPWNGQETRDRILGKCS